LALPSSRVVSFAGVVAVFPVLRNQLLQGAGRAFARAAAGPAGGFALLGILRSAVLVLVL
jgi:hypothetical protein